MNTYNQEILLISEEKLKSFTVLNTNLSPEDLTPHVFNSQNIMLPNYLGSTYYNALKERVIEGTLTAADEYLLDQYIGPLLCNWALYYASTFLNFRLYNKGILKGTSENGETIDLDELKFMQSQIKLIAESYSDQMVYWIRQNSTQYPLYNSPNSLDGYLPDKMSAYTTNLVTNHYPYAATQRLTKRYRNGGYGYYGGGGGYDGISCYDLPNTGN